MMDLQECKNRLLEVQSSLQNDPNTAWCLVELVTQLLQVVSELHEVVTDVDNLAATSVEHKLRLDSLNTKYSEVLYKLKPGD